MKCLKCSSVLLAIMFLLLQIPAAAYTGIGGSASYTYDEKAMMSAYRMRILLRSLLN